MNINRLNSMELEKWKVKIFNSFLLKDSLLNIKER